ncbi:hypothetical protein [Streptomyces huasconensis]|uniref:hypothetical protein n=1 Tax=Streptomyces huasconensis TaxID=1854574 RepID=UPI0033CEBDEF
MSDPGILKRALGRLGIVEPLDGDSKPAPVGVTALAAGVLVFALLGGAIGLQIFVSLALGALTTIVSWVVLLRRHRAP